jgi:peroxiredoxin
MLALGTACPNFALADAATGRSVTLADFAAKRALLVMFICNHCPYVLHVRRELTKIPRDYLPRSVGIVAINSNSIKTHPQDGPEPMARLARELGWEHPYVFDATQTIAKAFSAVCTPEFYLFDGARKLVYRGQLDDSRPGNDRPVTGHDVRAALEALLAGTPVSDVQKPSIGCNIKWDG